MRSVVLTATLASSLWLAAPSRAAAQDPDPAPSPAPAPAREVAVPRAERIRMRDTETDGRVANESVRRAEPAHRATNASAANADDEQQRRGAVRRPPSSDGGSRGGSRGGAVDRTPDRSGGRTTTADRSGDRSGDRSDGRGRGDTADGSTGIRDRAVPRTRPPYADRNDVYYIYPRYFYNRYYDPWGYGGWGPGFAYFTPWGYGPGYYGGYGFGYGYGYGGGYGAYGRYDDVGTVKIKVKPRDAEVYVDNYFAGYVDDFDGVFQALKVEAGGHRIEVRKPGFETLQFDVHVQPERNVTFRGDMKPTP